MRSLGQSIATGALWMVTLKVAERGIGFVSTVILARLLVPADFGLVAMAMAVFAILEVAGQFGFDHALLRVAKVDRSRYDTAWTLTVLHGLVSAVLLAVSAPWVAGFFADARLEKVIYALALMAAVQGFENIGIVLFRKELEFNRDFNFFLAKKLVSFCFTMILAYTFRSYWALVGGMMVSRAVGVVLSYTMHPYRPRFTLAATGELFRFSRWVLLNGLLKYVRGRGPDLLIGRFVGASGLGTFRVASELASLPTTELMHPILRATYPGYARLSEDRAAMKSAFLSVQGMVIMVTLPAGIGIVLVADPAVRLLLGPRWLDAAPLIQILGVSSAIRVFQLTNSGVFNALGKPYWNTVFHSIDIVAVLPLFGWMLFSGQDLDAAVLAYLVSSLVVVPVAVSVMSRQLGLTFAERVRTVWRPVASTVVMATGVWLVGSSLGSAENAKEALVNLLALVATGAALYVLAVLAFWFGSGRPDGAERRLFLMLSARLGTPRPQ